MKVFKISAKESGTLFELLSRASKLPPEKITDAAEKGAVWLQRQGKGKILRERISSTLINPKDILTLYYDARVLSFPYLENAQCLGESKHYGVWLKKAGVVTQGTQTGDHASLLRYVERTLSKETFLVHRLDRETEGLTVIAYTSEGAKRLSALFSENKIKKTYEAIVLGTMTPGRKETIAASLDDKEAITHFEVIDSTESQSLIRVQIETGRFHQIRRHLDFIGHPVIGDPKYGQGNKNRTGLKLLAQGLSFLDPWDRTLKTWETSNHLSFT